MLEPVPTCTPEPAAAPALPPRPAIFLALVALAGVVYFAGLNAFPLSDPDEVFYAQTAREMLERHSVLTPLMFGQPQFEKPPLTYWCLMASFKVFGRDAVGRAADPRPLRPARRARDVRLRPPGDARRRCRARGGDPGQRHGLPRAVDRAAHRHGVHLADRREHVGVLPVVRGEAGGIPLPVRDGGRPRRAREGARSASSSSCSRSRPSCS